MSTPAHLKSLIAPLRAAMAEFSEVGARAALGGVLAEDAKVRLSHPLGDMTGAELYDHAYAPLFEAMPDLERRDLIVVAGSSIFRPPDILPICGITSSTVLNGT